MTDFSPEQTIEAERGPAEVPETRRSHPIVRLDYLVRLLACPLPGVIIVSARRAAAEPIPPSLWIAMIVYAILWPQLAFLLASRSRDGRRAEMRLLIVDGMAIGASVALTSFQTVPTLTLLAGYVTIAGSVGGPSFLAAGLAVFLASVAVTAQWITGWPASVRDLTFSTILSALALVGFQVMMGLLTYRTARGFVRSRRKIAEQSEEIRRQNDALVEAREEALQAAQAKAAFLATMSHEIRTPLNGVLGMTRLLAETPLTAEQQDFVRTIQVSGTTLLAVINDVLDYSRIESGRMELEREPLSLRGVVEEALEIVGTRARENGLELVCELSPDTPDLFVGDATRLRQILTNLAGNAVKFTERGEVVIGIRLRRPGTTETPAEIEFSVRDTGIGIPEDRLALLFAPFSQADASTTRRYGGTGLGLAISRRLVELMGGTISVESVPGKGSIFTFTIQAVLAAERRQGPRLASDSLAGVRVLVVDDNATNRRVLSHQLQAWGMRPEAVGSANDALQALDRDGAFALAIVDLHMPDVDGLTLAQRIRERERFRDLPLILLSSSLVQSKDDPQRYFRARLLKPVRQSKLFDSVVRALDHARGESTFDRTSPGLKAIPSLPAMRVLVADDNEVNRKLAGLVLGRFGYEPDFAVHGREAVEAVERASTGAGYHLVFMDVQMPEMDGLEATRRIRRLQARHPSRQWPHIAAMTADAMPEDREICLAAGMDDYLTKPLDFDAVRDVLVKTGERIPANGVERIAAVEEASSNGAVDWSRLEELRAYDTPDGAVVQGVIQSFIDESQAKLPILRNSAAARDAHAIRASAHALKGAALNVGAVAVADRAREIEDAGKASALDGIDRLIADLSAALPVTIGELTRASARWRAESKDKEATE